MDTIGVTKSCKTDSRPLERKPGVPLRDLLGAIVVGAKDEDLFTSLANRLTRLDKQITDKEKAQFIERTNGKSLSQVVKDLLNAYDPDVIESTASEILQSNPDKSYEASVSEAKELLIEKASSTFNGELNEFIDNVRKAHEQIIDIVNPDKIDFAGWDKSNKDKATEIVNDFKNWLEEHKNEITALQIYYNQPYRRRELTYTLIKDIVDKLKAAKPGLAPLRVWQAYEQLENVKASPKNELIALVSLIRRIINIDNALTPYDKSVDKNFQDWVFKKQAGALKFNEEQMNWLRMMKEHIATSFHIERDDMDYSPFDSQGGLGKMWQLFGEKTDEIINELNDVLAA